MKPINSVSTSSRRCAHQFADVEAAKLSKLKLKPGRGVEALVDFDVLTPTEEHAEDHDPFAVRDLTLMLQTAERHSSKPARVLHQFCSMPNPSVQDSDRILHPCTIAICGGNFGCRSGHRFV